MDTENPPSIFSVSARFFPVARAVTGISTPTLALITEPYGADMDLLHRKILVLQPLAIMQRRQRLFRSRNQILIRARIFALSNFV